MLRLAVVAAMGVFLAGLFVLPTLAGDDLRLTLASVMKAGLPILPTQAYLPDSQICILRVSSCLASSSEAQTLSPLPNLPRLVSPFILP